MKRSVYIRGRGAVTPMGIGCGALLDGIFSGRSAIAPLRRLREVGCDSGFAAELTAESMGGQSSRVADLIRHICVESANQALEDARVVDRRAAALVLATTKADLSGVVGKGDGFGIPARLLSRLAEILGIEGPRAAVSCACASGLVAIAHAARWISCGIVDEAVVVGVDVLNEFIVRGFQSLLTLDVGPCRPFDTERRGLTLGEGAAAIVLSAARRNVDDAIVAGWGCSNDAMHATAPDRNGSGLLVASERALQLASMSIENVGYIHLHGTGSLYNDAMEARAMARLFGGRTPASSGTKSQTGHMLGACGIVESIVAVEALNREVAPINVGLANSGVDAELNLVRNAERIAPGSGVLKVAAGFGGFNAAVVFKK